MNAMTLERFFHRPIDGYKYQFGHVLVIGGSPGMIGAPYLVAKAALRTGSGLVSIASRPDVIDKLEKRAVEIMTVRIDTSPSLAIVTLLNYIKERKVNALVIGNGLTAEYAPLIKSLLKQTNLPTVIDSGAFLPFQDNLSELTALGQKNNCLILTPHAGEFASLSGSSAPSDQKTLEKVVTDFSKDHHITLVYKAHNTLVAHSDGTLYRNTTGNPGMATAGSGDVLAGIIGGLLAQKLTPSEASELGVYIHGSAGDVAAFRLSEPGLIASDIIKYLPRAWQTLAKLQ